MGSHIEMDRVLFCHCLATSTRENLLITRESLAFTRQQIRLLTKDQKHLVLVDSHLNCLVNEILSLLSI